METGNEFIRRCRLDAYSENHALAWPLHHDRMKNLILVALASISLISLAACSDDTNRQTTTTTADQSASMQTDTKDMKPVQH